ncbi:histidine triad (HIT) family protein [Sporobacter termitidis DSM 10068]|uniref:Histidine triad (HIT) family protein n=1 Tax=Sporobacter termitidis DSM 10068 TaxID=1123282 RepID=A0A1M5Y4H2_9FIRM|nr:histidine triad nucleotide-binding protein [Sporobacter termitidis]SHI06866.1 histidine triad (HIT) family protein [Sporobacter termitidis DSM 10068]
MSDCIFCKIAAGEIPSTKRYEDEEIIAFNDLYPQAPVHFLVVPKKHIASAADITPENSAVVSKCFEVIAQLAKKENLSGGFRVITNSGADAGQTVDHLHFHILAGSNLGPKLCPDK